MWANLYTNAAKILLIPALGICVLLLWLRFGVTPEPTYRNVPGPTQYVPQVVKQTVTVPGPERIRIVPVDIVREKMKWPDLADNTITATGVVPPHRGPTNVAAVASVDATGTMTTQLVMKQMPPKFWELKKEVRLGAYYGNGGVFSGEAALRPLRIGPADAVLKATGMWGDGVNEARAFVGVEVQFGF